MVFASLLGNIRTRAIVGWFYFEHVHILEYATVGYMAKRIQMRKNRFLAIQKIAEQKNINIDGSAIEGDHAPKQTVSFRLNYLSLIIIEEAKKWMLVSEDLCSRRCGSKCMIRKYTVKEVR